MSKVNLGDEVKDMVTGYKGIAVARHLYLQGCNRISIQGPVNKDGKVPEWVSVDEPQLEVTKPGKVKPQKLSEDSPSGGPAKYIPSERPASKR